MLYQIHRSVNYSSQNKPEFLCFINKGTNISSRLGCISVEYATYMQPSLEDMFSSILLPESLMAFVLIREQEFEIISRDFQVTA